VGERGAPRDGRAVEGGGMTSRSDLAARARRRAWARRQGRPSGQREQGEKERGGRARGLSGLKGR
jgi:hypothetical protein